MTTTFGGRKFTYNIINTQLWERESARALQTVGFLAVLFKKQEISQQVLFHNFHLIVFFGSNNQDQGRNHGKKVEIL